MDVRLPDGTVIRGVPDGMSKADLTAKLESNGYDVSALQEPSLMSKVGQQVGNAVAGAVRGAGSIGATLLYPVDKAMDLYHGDRGKNVSSLVTGVELPSRNEERRAAMDGGLRELGADTDSLAYKGGKLGAEIAGTAGAGGAVARAGAAIPGVAAAAPNLLQAIRTSGMTAGAGGGAGNLLTRAAGGAIAGGASAGLVNPDDALTGAAIGGAFPVATKAAGAAGKAIGGALRGDVSPEVVKLADRAKQLGIDIPADRIANSKPLDAVAAGLNYVPFSGRAGTEAKMTSQLNQALSKTFGQDSSNVTQALRTASADLGAKFDQTLRSTGVAVDQQLMTDLAGVYNTAERELGSDALKPIAGQIDELITKGANGTIDGQAAYNIKRTLDRIGRQNTPTAHHALELKGVLMDALDRSLGPQGAQAFAETRRQYGNMLALEKLAKNGVDGEISVARLANLKNINNPQLQEIADIAAQFVKPREGQHGAAQRAVAGLAGASVAGVPALAGAAVAGRAANAGLNSNALRGLVTGQQAAPNALMQLAAPQVYRALPVISAQ